MRRWIEAGLWVVASALLLWGCARVSRHTQRGPDLSEAQADTVRPPPDQRRPDLRACTTDGDCDDGLLCTESKCTAGQCQRVIASDSCVIDGACRLTGTTPAGDVCRYCDPQRTRESWSGVSGCSRRGYVASVLLTPSTALGAAATGVDLDGDGKVDNALGAVFVTLENLGLDVQLALETDVALGKLLLLFDARWQGALPQGDVELLLRLGSDRDFPIDNFSGSEIFDIAASSPRLTVLRGSISSGLVDVRSDAPGAVPLPLPGRLLFLPATHARVVATAATDELTLGRIVGSLAREQVDKVLVPALAQALDDLLRRPSTLDTARGAVLALLDTNGDGSISTIELQQNSTTQKLLAGDVDLDQNGVKEVSFGFGFSAVSCIIAP